MTEAMDSGRTPVAPVTRRLLRSRRNRVLAGVCGGIAEYLGGDPTFVRLAAIVFGIMTGIFPMLIAYTIAAIVVPEAEGGPTEVAPAPVRSGQAGLLTGVLLLVLGLAALANQVLHVDWDLAWPAMLVVFGAALVAIAWRR